MSALGEYIPLPFTPPTIEVYNLLTWISLTCKIYKLIEHFILLV